MFNSALHSSAASLPLQLLWLLSWCPFGHYHESCSAICFSFGNGTASFLLSSSNCCWPRDNSGGNCWGSYFYWPLYWSTLNVCLVWLVVDKNDDYYREIFRRDRNINNNILQWFPSFNREFISSRIKFDLNKSWRQVSCQICHSYNFPLWLLLLLLFGPPPQRFLSWFRVALILFLLTIFLLCTHQ